MNRLRRCALVAGCLFGASFAAPGGAFAVSDAGCSEAQLRSAVTAGGDYVFTCPPGTPIIYVSSPLVVTSPVSLDATGQNLRIANVTGSRLFTVNSGSLELIEVQAIGYMDGTNGTPGDDGANGASGVNGAGLACDESNEGLTAGNGSFGVPGTSGTPGGDAPGVARGGAIYIEAGASVSLFGGRLLGTVQGGNGGQGGSGGAGGSGGDGGGVTGVAAIDCPRDITGGDGGNGADAGHGAAGGDGADAQGGGVYVESGATLNATGTSFEPFSVAFGAAQGGEGGGGGEGGEGGYPGDGGVGGGGTLNGSNGASSGTGGNGGTGGDSGMAQGGAIYSEGTVNLRDAVFTDTGVLAGPGGVGGSGGDGHGADAPGAGAGGDGADGGSAGDVAGGAIYNTGVLNVYSASFERSSAGLGSGFGAGGNGGSGGDVIHPNFLNPAGDGGDGGDGGDAAFASIFGTIATIGCASFTDSSVVPGPGGGAGGGGTQGFSGGTDGASGSPGFAGAAGQLDPPGFAPPPCPGMRVNEVMLSTGGNGAAQFVELIDPADETFPAGPNEPYKVVVYDAAGTKTGEHAISTGLLAGRDNTQPLLLSTAAADSALGVTGDEVLGPTLPSVGQVCFTTGPGEIKVSCVAWGCVTSVVGVSTSLVAAPADGKSAQRQSIGGAFFQVADPTPKATNVAGTNPPRCVASSGGGSGGGGGGSGGGGSGGGGEGSGGGGSGGGGGVSSDFTIKGTASSSKDGTVTVSIDLPGPGKVGATATAKVEKALLAKSKKITVAKKTVNAAAAGVVKLKLKPRKAAKRVLRKKGKLKATVKVTYTPTGGAAKTLTRKVTFKLTRKKKKR